MRPSLAATTPPVHQRRQRAAIVLSAVATLLIAGVAGTPQFANATPLADKQAQAAKLDREVGRLESRYARLQERWRGSLVELRELQRDQREAQADLRVARTDLSDARQRLQSRASAIYRDGSGSTQVLQVAQAGSLSEFFDKVDAIERVGDQDTAILARVRGAAVRVQRQERVLRASRDQQAVVVRKAAAAKRTMGRVLGQKQAKLGSVTAEIRGIMEAQRAAAAAAETAGARGRAAAIRSGAGATTQDAAGTGSATVPGSDGGSPQGSSGGGEPATSSIPLPPASGSASAAASIAMGKVGVPYVYGAAGPNSFDCSGLVVWAFAQAGRSGLPHSTYSLIGMGVEVPLSQAQVGDLVFTNNSGHMGIYVGGGSFVHAPRTGRNVTVESLQYYTVVSVRRI